MLNDIAIKAAIKDGGIAIDPFDETLLQPASVDLRLGRGFLVFRRHRDAVIDPGVDTTHLTELTEPLKGEPFILHPGEFALAHTFERIFLGPMYGGRVEGKSSLGRLGLQNHSTAGFIDPGFSGQLTLELSNVNIMPIALWPGMRIGQLCVFRIDGPIPTSGYGVASWGSRYQGQEGPTASRSHVNFRIDDV